MYFTQEFRKIDLDKIGNEMFELSKRLFPICRSITGDGVRETLSIINEYIPLSISEVPSGTKVLDWEIPEEWNIQDAWVKNSKGEKIVDFKNSNLHVVNYSIPVDKKVSLNELKEHIFTIPEYPEWIPYKTTYYNRNWGFCMPHKLYEQLDNGEYQVKIESELKKGLLTYGELLIKGRLKEEVLFSCHICHPSLCNDNLSGIVIATQLANILKKFNLKNSYRFVFVPGTIGAISWLSQNEQKVQNIKSGLVLTLLGDSSSFHYKKSRKGNADVDSIMEYLLNQNEESKIHDFSPYGYDERQYCSPGFNLPVGRITRTPFGEFPEYHTSADNLDFIGANNLSESISLLFQFISIMETNSKYYNLFPKGEPQLGKRGLYDSSEGQNFSNEYRDALLWILNLSDGNHTLLDIAIKSKLKFESILQSANQLNKAGLLKEIV